MPRRDARPDEGLIHAWLDGELGAEEAARVQRLVAEDAEWAAAAAEARGLVAASTRILGALDVVAGDVITHGGSAAGVTAPMFGGSRVPSLQFARRRVPTWLRVAAGLVLVAGVGYLGLDRSEPDLASTVASDLASGATSQPAPSVARSTDRRVASTATPSASPSASRAATSNGPPNAPLSASPSLAQGVRQGAGANERETDLARRDAAIAASPVAPPAAVSALVQPQSAPAVARGVAGGVATDVATRPAAEAKERLGTLAGVPERETRAKSMQQAITAAPSARMERTLDSPNSVGAAMMDRTAESASVRAIVTGCWRTQTTARVDSVQSSLRVVRSAGDTLSLALTPAGAEARVVRVSGDTLRGVAREASGIFVGFIATRTDCRP